MMSNKLTNAIALILLTFVFVFTIASIKNDSLTMDELAHLPAGYSYLTQKDMRLNPEHPPLIKDFAAIPLLFIKDISFPSEIKAWKEDVNGQWEFGNHFLFKTGNPADEIIFWGRIPMILVLILLGFYIFRWAKELFGNKVALFALTFFSFSPTFLTHGRLVTTDVGAAAGIFIATYYFLKFLKRSCRKNLIFAGLALGFAQLLKFSVILLFPFFGILTLVWAIINSKNSKIFLKIFTVYCLKFVAILVICFLLIGVVYQYHVWNYPPERQVRDSEVFLAAYPDLIKDPLLWAADKPVFRPYVQYFTGLLMVFHRAAFGHTTYFLGEISNLGWKHYFPIVYLIKEPLSFHILTLIALLCAAWLINPPLLFRKKGNDQPDSIKSSGGWQNTFQGMKSWTKNHFPEFAMVCFIIIYWIVAIRSPLNIGVRHLLPIFPFMYILVSQQITRWLKLKTSNHIMAGKYILTGGLLIWYLSSSLMIYPHFLAYFNELVGGPNNGYLYVVDSNYDWGQDLKRLKKFVEENKIEKIYVDYFGGADTRYYLKEKYEPWWGGRNEKEFPKGNYLAVSSSLLQGGKGIPVPGFDQPTGYYRWLDNFEPIGRAGKSIFIYYIE